VSASCRVGITGLGVLGAVGIGRRAFWEALLAGRSGVRPVESFDASALPSRIAGEIPDFDPKAHVAQRKALKVMARDIQLAAACAAQAVADAGLDARPPDPERFGVTLGAGLICSCLDELGPSCERSRTVDGRVDFAAWGREGLGQLFPLWLLKYLPNMLASHVTIFHNAQGPSNSITTGEASGVHAIGEAYHTILRGAADVMLAGGAESKVNPMSMLRYCQLGLASTHANDTPERACRPFDLNRDGLAAAEGGGVVVLEALEAARARGARVYAEVTGCGLSCDTDGGLAVGPSGDRQAAAIRAALDEAGLDAADVDHVHAQGVGTVAADLAESRALRTVFDTGPGGVPISATKGLTGHAAAGAGAMGVVTAALAVAEGAIPGHASLEHPDPACGLESLVTATLRRPVRRTLVNTFSLVGQNAVLIVEQVRE
jgi:3-oxoacyl-[acyl-carrier-protein] synthase II